jgi:hypothetical protein
LFSSPFGLSDLLILFWRCFFVATDLFGSPRFFLFFCFSLGMMLLPPVADSLVGLLGQASDGQRLI